MTIFIKKTKQMPAKMYISILSPLIYSNIRPSYFVLNFILNKIIYLPVGIIFMEKEDTKTKIFKTAAKLFSQNGYYNVSVNEICNAAGVTKPALYYYFKDKEDLLLELINESHRVAEHLFDQYILEENSFIENLNSMFRFYTKFVNEYTYLIPFSFSIQYAPLPHSIKSIINSRLSERWKVLNSFFKKGQNEGVLSADYNSEMIMRSLFNVLSVIVIQYVLKEDDTQNLQMKLEEYFEFWKKNFLKI
jgi:AcrR family transcriptional regulator